MDSVQDIRPSRPLADELAQVSSILGLGDSEISRVFPENVTSETISSWRAGDKSGQLPRTSLLYRLEALYQIAVAFKEAGLNEKWLRRPTVNNGPSPLELLLHGYLVDVREMIAVVAAGLTDPNEPAEIPLVPFGYRSRA